MSSSLASRVDLFCPNTVVGALATKGQKLQVVKCKAINWLMGLAGQGRGQCQSQHTAGQAISSALSPVLLCHPAGSALGEYALGVRRLGLRVSSKACREESYRRAVPSQGEETPPKMPGAPKQTPPKMQGLQFLKYG